MFDPFTFWMQGTVYWMKLIKQQQEAYLRVLGSFAEKIPHEDSAKLAREAEALKKSLQAANKPAAPAKQVRKDALVNA